MEKIIRRFQTHGGLGATGLALIAIAISNLTTVFADSESQSDFNNNPLFWIAIVFVLLALLMLYYALVWKPSNEIPSIKDSARTAETIWGMWWSGDRQRKMMMDSRYRNRYKRILLPDVKSKVFEQMMVRADIDSRKIVPLIKRLTKLAVTSGIEVRWFG